MAGAGWSTSIESEYDKPSRPRVPTGERARSKREGQTAAGSLNPLDSSRVPGGSSSGSAVAVAGGEADLAYGSDTGGSIRVPAAFCGIAGLKTTHGWISLAGVWPLAPSMDTIGPMARDVAGVAAGLAGQLVPGTSGAAEQSPSNHA
jgi:Asp-tRNA(Asn)/Glu-tRNA(Gln) amidotransferase A subunit family amidase